MSKLLFYTMNKTTFNDLCNRYHLWCRKHAPKLQPLAKQNITFLTLKKKNMATCRWVASNTTLLPIAMYCRRQQCRISLVWTATIKDALFLESNDDACCSLQAAFPCHLPKRRTLPFCNNTNIFNAFRVFKLKCLILKNAFQASFILIALLHAHYNVLFEVLKNCGNKIPTRCNRGFYCRSYCLLNMFRAQLCPSSGAQEYYTMVAACGISSTPDQQLENRSTKYHRQQPLCNTLELLMMGIVVPETCWASNKICNKNLCCI